MSNLKMNCGYCGKKCSSDKDFCIPQDSVYICKSCYERQNKIADLEAKLAESEDRIAKARRQAYSSRQMDNTLKIRRLADEITAKEKAITKLKQQLAEERKKVVQEIKDKISDGLYRNSYGETFIDGDIYEILDKIQGDDNNENKKN